MGHCFSDLEGGKQAVGGAQQRRTGVNNGGHNDAVDFFYRSRGLQPLFTQIELFLSTPNLLDHDITSKCDVLSQFVFICPSYFLYLTRFGKLGRTEVVLNSLYPAWIKKVTIAFQFEIVQPLMLKLKDQEFLGEATCVLSEIVTKQTRSLTLNLHIKNGHTGLRNFGALTIHAEETVALRSCVEIIVHCSHLDNKDLFSKSDHFLRISRIVKTGGSIPIFRTEVVNNNLNPIWKPLCLSVQQFGSKDNPLIIECFDFKSSGNYVLIGKLQKSMADLEKLYKEGSGANLTSTSSHHGHDKVLKGWLFMDQFCEKQQYSFLDYISSGSKLNFMVAIDFTDSLHYIDPSGRLNSYQRAILEVGEVIQFYDSDRRFPAWGFGGRTCDGTTSHCFNLNGNACAFEVEGIEGIMAAYSSALHNVALAGPTLFGQVINKVAQIASQSHLIQQQQLLLMRQSNSHQLVTNFVKLWTDPNPLQKSYHYLYSYHNSLVKLTYPKIPLLSLLIHFSELVTRFEFGLGVRASDLPLSILVVGVMEVLDADDGRRLESSIGHVATRDFVQFVPMREVHSGQISVVQALLEELPGQFLTFMRGRDIKPRPFHVAPTYA
ncbi:hypothetical protein RGQ29_014264 [Quercus rubra]|uniref:C2 domain-containing protein n=1 Tax=Quercus rubra TaxID=3512 RepID=A0AAN7J0E8_QUERU|nr:hypothetical protein RGQ29_014264 [Quercus rubra]